MPAPASSTDADPVLFYDDTCGLCARSVQWILRHDRHERIRFAPLNGVTFAGLSHPGRPLDGGSVVLLDAAGIHVRSDAVLRVMRIVGGVWRLLAAVGRLMPRALRDGLYRLVARNRHRWFGSEDACRLASPEERARFLE